MNFQKTYEYCPLPLPRGLINLPFHCLVSSFSARIYIFFFVIEYKFIYSFFIRIYLNLLDCEV